MNALFFLMSGHASDVEISMLRGHVKVCPRIRDLFERLFHQVHLRTSIFDCFVRNEILTTTRAHVTTDSRESERGAAQREHEAHHLTENARLAERGRIAGSSQVTPSLTQPLSQSPTHSLTHSLTLTHLLTHSLTHSITHSPPSREMHKVTTGVPC